MISEHELGEFIAQKTMEEWNTSKYPYLLAKISPDLREQRGVSYKETILPWTLKQFIENKLSSAVTVVSHPLKRAKIGVIPHGKQFTFDDIEYRRTENQDPTTITSHGKIKERDTSFYNKRTVTQFISLVGRLEREDLEKVIIPIDVLSKLINMQ